VARLSPRKRLHWQLAETPREVFCPCNAKLADILLSPGIRHAHRDRHELRRSLKFDAYRYESLIAIACGRGAKLHVSSFHAYYRASMRFASTGTLALKLRSVLGAGQCNDSRARHILPGIHPRVAASCQLEPD
jgi:hypothetical protein